MNGGDFDERLSRFLSDLESLPPEDPLPESSLLDLDFLLPSSFSSAKSSGFCDDSPFPLWSHLAAIGLSPSSLLRPLAAAMDLSSPHTSLLTARVYLSLILTPSAPVLSLFSPLAFISLLSSLRQALKPLPSPPSPDCQRKRKQGRAPRGKLRVDDAPNVGDLLPTVLGLLDSVLSRIRLDSLPDGVKSLVETIVAILSSSASDQHGLSDVCFRILFSVVSRHEQGFQTAIAVEVLRALGRVVLSSPLKSALRTSTISFVACKIASLARENGEIRKALVYFPRYLASNAPERAEPRAATVDAILEVVRAFEKDDRIGFAEYVVKMTQGKWQLRLLAADLILGLLTSLPDPLGACESLEGSSCWGMKCLKALLLRCSDSMAGVRARALTNMAQVIEILSRDARNSACLQEGVAFGNAKFNERLRKRCLDEKAAVRKASLFLITRSSSLMGSPIDNLVLKTIGSSCMDPLVSIRKAAMSAISEVYRRFPDEVVISEWLHAVPRLIADNETSIQEECENFFLELLLDRISQASHVSISDATKDLESIIPEGVLTLLKGICDGEVLPCVKKICTSLGKKKKLKPSIAISLENIISISESLYLRNCISIERWTAPIGAWQLLSEVSLFTPKAVHWKFLHHHWKLLDKAKGGKGGATDGEGPNSISWGRDRVSLLQTISNVSLLLSPMDASDLAADLLKQIDEFNMHLSEVDAHVKALRTLCKQKALSPKEGDELIGKWVHQLLSGAQNILESYMSKLSETVKTDSFFTPQRDRRKRKDESASSKLLSQAITAAFTIGSLVLIYPSADLHGIVPLLHTMITSGKSVAETTKLVGVTVSVKERAPSLYIQSWVAMGKICLVDDKLATLYIPLFVQELEKSDCAAVRNNILVVMADFCVRHTALVDCYIPKITTALRDPCEVVRRQTFILLSRLLQRDYVKWRGALFLRFLLSLVDDSEKIRSLADYLFGNILKVKAPLLAYNSFIEAIFFLNGCNAHSGQSEAPEKVSQLFSLSGKDEKARSKRMHIYVSLLKQMAPEHLLATSAKLCAEILAAASDGLLSIDDVAGQSVVRDCLHILACKEMRIQSSKASDTAEMDDEGGDYGGAAGATVLAAKGRVVTQVAKKNLVQHAVPIFIELKRLLESKNSPLMGSLMDCLRVLLKDYRKEIDEILVADKQLQKELIYDMEKYEAAKAKSTVAEAMANPQQNQNVLSPADRAVSATSIFVKLSEKLGSGGKIGSAVADAAAEVTAKSVLREANQSTSRKGTVLPSKSIPRVRFSGDARGSDGAAAQQAHVLQSLRRRKMFESDDED
ncbi:condensin-2 complex subunit D3 [Phalaenopsis equestris]|uniref:condensin-2 complex subunit D3 n=1 Tax=Phalaenopsis equestris TaxID=78828 RepID=UPI0009E3E3B7|nr:condensin-2 complex subunit D3 [Phalaenopsis equestris]